MTMRLKFRQSDFADDSSQISNTFLPLTPGTQFAFQGVANRGGGLINHQVIFTVTDLARTIDGVNTVVVWDRDINDGVLQEAELAFFAQDKKGNVWNLAEYPEEYEDGNFIGAPNTWVSGEKDARGGVHMLADTEAGTQRYLQGIVPSIEFHDIARIIEIGKEISVAGKVYKNVIVTEEWDPADLPAKQHKFYAPNVGIVKITAVNDPEGETLNLIGANQLTEEELVTARQEALKLENRAYHISKVYREADPAGRFDHEDDITGGDGDDILSGGSGGDDINGGGGDDMLNGRSGRDDLNGGGGDDTLNGGAGKDLLHGKAGDDILDGGGGDDGMWGGKGADAFLFADLENGKTEVDTIEDYDVAQADLIDLPEGAGSIETAERVNGVWQLTLAGDGDVIRLPGIRDVRGNGILDDLFLT